MTPRRQPQDQDDFAAEPRSLDLREYWLIVRRRWRLIVVIALVGAIGGVEYAHHSGVSYTAQASVVVSAVTQGPQAGSTPVTTQVNMSTEQTIAQSAAVVQLAAAKLGVPVVQLEASAAKRLSVSVPASTLTTSNVLQVGWQAYTPALAQQGADAFAAAYLSYRQHVLAGLVASLRKNLQEQASTLNKEIGSLAGQLGKTTAGTSANQVLTVQLTQVSQQYNTTEAELAAIPDYNTSGGQLISAATPSKPSGFGRSVYGAIGLILGLLIGLVIAFARDLFDDKMRDAGQLEQHLGAVTLAVLPASVSGAEGRHSRSGLTPVIAMAAAPDGGAAEAARTMRAAVIAISSRRQLATILLVGADASVSSSQVVAELGVALAESDRSVLVVASDLRSSVLPGIFGAPNGFGLSELLVQGGDPRTVIYRPQEASGAPLPDEISEQLSLLPSGRPTPFALSALDSARMRDLLRGQREDHEFILLDAPAAVGADILPLAAHVDGVIVLVREKRTVGKDIDDLRHRLEQVGVPIVGGVLVRRRRLGRGRSHGSRPTPTARRPVAEEVEPATPTPVAGPAVGKVAGPAVGKVAGPAVGTVAETADETAPQSDLTMPLRAISRISVTSAGPGKSPNQPQ
jgi:Mrp family chromosome partitioning ATPase/capsular polysaccharide biosynthesis protein